MPKKTVETLRIAFLSSPTTEIWNSDGWNLKLNNTEDSTNFFNMIQKKREDPFGSPQRQHNHQSEIQ